MNQEIYEAYKDLIIKSSNASYKTLGYIVNEDKLAKTIAEAVLSKKTMYNIMGNLLLGLTDYQRKHIVEAFHDKLLSNLRGKK